MGNREPVILNVPSENRIEIIRQRCQNSMQQHRLDISIETWVHMVGELLLYIDTLENKSKAAGQ